AAYTPAGSKPACRSMSQAGPRIKHRSPLPSNVRAGPSPRAQELFIGLIGPRDHVRAKHMDIVPGLYQRICLLDQARIDRGLPWSHQANFRHYNQDQREEETRGEVLRMKITSACHTAPS